MGQFAHDRVFEILNRSDPGAMLVKFVLVIEGLDREADSSLYVMAPDDMSADDMMDLLRKGQQAVRENSGF